MLAIAEVRVKRGSTWIRVQGFFGRVRACITQRKATGWHSAMFDPMMRMQSECLSSEGGLVAAPRPNVAPRPGTEALCHIRAWFSMFTTPSARISFAWT